jgi:hypothetical protein
MCWYCAAEDSSEPLASSGAMRTSDPNRRIVVVSGTT